MGTVPGPQMLDIAVGVMIESPYGWKEYCNRHAAAYLAVWDRPNRDVSLYEVLVSHREYRCQMCGNLIWGSSPEGDN